MIQISRAGVFVDRGLDHAAEVDAVRERALDRAVAAGLVDHEHIAVGIHAAPDLVGHGREIVVLAQAVALERRHDGAGAFVEARVLSEHQVFEPGGRARVVIDTAVVDHQGQGRLAGDAFRRERAHEAVFKQQKGFAGLVGKFAGTVAARPVAPADEEIEIARKRSGGQADRGRWKADKCRKIARLAQSERRHADARRLPKYGL